MKIKLDLSSTQAALLISVIRDKVMEWEKICNEHDYSSPYYQAAKTAYTELYPVFQDLWLEKYGYVPE